METAAVHSYAHSLQGQRPQRTAVLSTVVELCAPAAAARLLSFLALCLDGLLGILGKEMNNDHHDEDQADNAESHSPPVLLAPLDCIVDGLGGEESVAQPGDWTLVVQAPAEAKEIAEPLVVVAGRAGLLRGHNTGQVSTGGPQ